MKRTCNGCKALEDYGYGRCSLDHKIKSIHHPKYPEVIIGNKPLEECPKPMTHKKAAELFLKKRI
jgi:hypothetical protein